MERYTIYCTEEQTRKALELGAPIKTISYDPPVPPPTGWVIYKNNCCKPPTAEQMIGWLEGRYIDCFVGKQLNQRFVATVCIHEELIYSKQYPSRQEATLAAIDAALDYLSKNKK